MMLSKNALKMGVKKVSIWGLGYLGYTNLIQYTNNGLLCVVTDFDRDRIIDFDEKGFPHKRHVNNWDLTPKIDKNLIEIAETPEALVEREDIYIHIICVQNENADGKPMGGYVEKSIKMICESIARKKEKGHSDVPLISIESSMEPYYFERNLKPLIEGFDLELGKDIKVAIAPRFDWDFLEFFNKSPYRVVAGCHAETTHKISEVLNLIGARPVGVDSIVVGELIALLKNAKKHMESSFVNQLSMAYPREDMNKIVSLLNLVDGSFTEKVSLGVSGYRLPVSSQLLLDGAENAEYLTLLQESLLTDFSMPLKVVDLFKKAGVKKVGILGLSSKKNLRGHTLSITLKLVELLKGNAIEVSVNDPFYSDEEIDEICNISAFSFPDDLPLFEGLVCMTDHNYFFKNGLGSLCERLTGYKLLIDNTGVLHDENVRSRLPEVDIRVVGNQEWLSYCP